MQIEVRGISPVNYKHTPGSLFLQRLGRFGALVDDLGAVGLFNRALV